MDDSQSTVRPPNQQRSGESVGEFTRFRQSQTAAMLPASQTGNLNNLGHSKRRVLLWFLHFLDLWPKVGSLWDLIICLMLVSRNNVFISFLDLDSLAGGPKSRKWVIGCGGTVKIFVKNDQRFSCSRGWGQLALSFIVDMSPAMRDKERETLHKEAILWLFFSGNCDGATHKATVETVAKVLGEHLTVDSNKLTKAWFVGTMRHHDSPITLAKNLSVTLARISTKWFWPHCTNWWI